MKKLTSDYVRKEYNKQIRAKENYEYSRWLNNRTNWETFRMTYESIRKAVKGIKFSHVVEVGPGPGTFTKLLLFLNNKANFVEVFVKCSLEECEKRDKKGLYEKARRGEIKDFTGIHAPYEEPQNPELIINTEENTAKECADKILNLIISP